MAGNLHRLQQMLMKRIVLRHTYGALAGLDQIQGVWPDRPVPARAQDKAGAWGILVKTEPRYVVYKTEAPTPEGQGANGDAA